ncbi:MFS transporter [Nocardioides humi]|uniref:MFS transporter n=1 Tax=Nocardioides humi TaxID=449461 RepID=A0ABN2AJS4_9ACTN|nr:MFS transporter [Nocardioides humi]
MCIAVTWGPGRNAFGVYVPQFRAELGASTEFIGVVAGGMYGGYGVALLAVGMVVPRFGVRLAVVIGIASAGLGMAVVAASHNSWVTASGLIIAASGAGWTWAPYSNAAAHVADPSTRARVLAVISSGAAGGFLIIGLLSVAAQGRWRLVWGLYAAMAVGALWANRQLPTRGTDPHRGGGTNTNLSQLSLIDCLRMRSARSLFAVATCYGSVSAFYFTFSTDQLVAAGLEQATAGAGLYAAMGLAGLLGLAAGDLIMRWGVDSVCTLTFGGLTGACLFTAAWPSSWIAWMASGSLAGASLMIGSALLAEWNSRTFSAAPTVGFTATLSLLALGSIGGPLVLSQQAAATGIRWAFATASAIAAVVALLPLVRRIASATTRTK